MIYSSSSTRRTPPPPVAVVFRVISPSCFRRSSFSSYTSVLLLPVVKGVSVCVCFMYVPCFYYQQKREIPTHGRVAMVKKPTLSAVGWTFLRHGVLAFCCVDVGKPGVPRTAVH